MPGHEHDARCSAAALAEVEAMNLTTGCRLGCALVAWSTERYSQPSGPCAFRQSLVDGNPIPAPAPNQDCPDVGGFFGNSNIFSGSYADPTTP